MDCMRVLHVTRDFPPGRNGGLSAAVGGLVRALDAAGEIESSVLSFDNYQPRRRSRASQSPAEHAKPEHRIFHVTQPADHDPAEDWVGRVSPAIIHVHDALLWEAVDPWIARWRLPRVFTVHVFHRAQNALRGVPKTRASRAEDTILRGAQAVIAPSRSLFDTLAATIEPRRLHHVGLGVDPPSEPLESFPSRPHVVFAGRFADVKGTDVFVAALPGLLARSPKLSVTMAGGIPQNRKGDQRWRARILEGVGPDAQPRVHLPGWLDPSQLLTLLRRTSVFVAPSRYETFGQGIAEALGLGLPVIAGDTPAIRELITPHVNGLLVPPGEVPPLIGGIMDLLRDPTRARSMGIAARERAARELQWSDVARAHGAVYAGLLGPPGV